MARDYARGRSSRRRAGEVTPRGGRRPSGQLRNSSGNRDRPVLRSLLWMFSGIAVGLLIAGVLYMKWQKHPVGELPPPDQPSKEVSASAPKSKATKSSEAKQEQLRKKAAETVEPHYDFYTTLSKDNVETPEPAEKAEAKNPAPTHYVLQVASVSTYQDADRLKAQLILLGYSVSISKQIHDGVESFKVNIGPFSSPKAAEARQESLRKDNIKSILVPL
jgi:cell division septation protein DedD